MSDNKNLVKPKKRPLPLSNIPPHHTLDNNLDLSDHADVKINNELLHFTMDNLEKVEELGKGSYGIVERRRHTPSNCEVAVKIIRQLTQDQRHNRLLNDLNISVRCEQCPYIVHSYGAMCRGGDIWICMEVMSTSLDLFDRKIPKGVYIEESQLSYIIFCMVSALWYLHRMLKVIHRDVKPSNVLLDRKGRVQLCDFGISGYLVNSIARTNVGSRLYLAPERIVNGSGEYTIRSDVWSLGITVVEIAARKFPFSKKALTIEHLNEVVHSDTMLTLPDDAPYSEVFRLFVARCVAKDPLNRANYEDLLQHELLSPLHNYVNLAEVEALFAVFVSKILDL